MKQCCCASPKMHFACCFSSQSLSSNRLLGRLPTFSLGSDKSLSKCMFVNMSCATMWVVPLVVHLGFILLNTHNTHLTLPNGRTWNLQFPQLLLRNLSDTQVQGSREDRIHRDEASASVQTHDHKAQAFNLLKQKNIFCLSCLMGRQAPSILSPLEDPSNVRSRAW